MNTRHPYITVILPVFNEEESIRETLSRIGAAVGSRWPSWEILVVNDGSTDTTASVVKNYQRIEPKVRLVSYDTNRGRGGALRTGFAHARGSIICTTDADLSYHESHLVKMVKILESDEQVDLVVASPYAKGGRTENVPFLRLLISKIANKVVGFAMKGNLSTVTGIARAYRAECIHSLELESEGKEINLEILSKAVAMGFRVFEMPAVLSGREKGRSKFRFTSTTLSHVLFSLYEKPVMLFGFIGLFLVALGLVGGFYMVLLWLNSSLNPERPLMTLMVILLLTGLQILLFGFLGTQLVYLRKEVYKTQRGIKTLEQKLLNRETVWNARRKLSGAKKQEV